MKISILQKVVFSFNILRTVSSSFNIGPKWAVIPFTQGGKQKVPYNQQLFLFKNPATFGFLKLQTGITNFNKFAFNPPIISLKTVQIQIPNI